MAHTSQHKKRKKKVSKKNITVSVDTEPHEYAIMRKANVSELCNLALHAFRNQEVGQVHAINIEIKRKELAKLQEEKITRDQEIAKRQLELENYDKRIQEAEIERLQKEKENLEKQSHCVKCSKEINSPIQIRGISYLLCLDCLSSLDKKELEKFRQEADV